MNKIISINLKGIVFQVEEEAFEQLKKYLEVLNRHFANEESRSEIIDDIESRIAEMMQQKLQTKAAITAADVEEIIAIMGSPADFGIDEAEEEEQTENQQKTTDYNVPPQDAAAKRFMRDTESGIFGGVCAGAGHYFGVEPLWIRLGFLFLFFVLGTGFLFYLILWVIIPEAKTPTERLQMKGEPVNIDTIGKTVKEEYERVKNNINDFSKTHKWNAKPINKFIATLGDIIIGIVKVVSKIFAFFFLALGIMVFIIMAGIAVKLSVDGTLPLISLAFENATEFWITAIAALLLLLVIGTGLMSATVALFIPRRRLFPKPVTISLGILGTVAVFAIVIMGIQYGTAFRNKENIATDREIAAGDTLVVSAHNPLYQALFGSYDANQTHSYREANIDFVRMDIDYIKTSSTAIKNDSLWCMAKFDVHQSEDSTWELEIIRTAYGRDDYMAQAYAQRIPLGYAINNGKLTLNTHFYLGEGVPYRGQQIVYRLWVPKGKVVKFEQGLTEIMQHNLKRKVTNPARYGMTWQMGEDGFRCLDCKSLTGKDRNNANTSVYNESDFTKVDVSIPVEVNIEQAADYEVFVTGPDYVRDNVLVYTDGKTLKIRVQDGVFDIFDGFNTSDVVVSIKTPNLESIEATGVAKVYLAGITNPKLNVYVNGASSIEGEVNVSDLNVELTGSSRATLNGRAINTDVEVVGASRFFGTDLRTDYCNIDAAGASRAEVYVQNSLKVDASGASNVEYKGGAAVQTDVSGASQVKHVQ